MKPSDLDKIRDTAKSVLAAEPTSSTARDDRSGSTIAAAIPSPPTARVFERGDHAELADALLDSINGDWNLTVFDEGTLWSYDASRGLYVRVGRDTSRRKVKGFAGAEKVSANGFAPLRISASAAEGAIVLAQAEVARTGFFDDAPAGVAFRNGFVVVRDGRIEILPHAAANRARVGFDFDYSPFVPHPQLDEFFEEVFADVSDDERAARTAIQQEFAGACIIGDAPKYQKALINYGPGDTGKSQGAQILKASHPGRVTSVSPHKWGERFSLAQMVGVRLNLVGELPSAELTSTETFKAVIVGDHVDAEEKYQPAFSFCPTAGHVFLANELPPTRDVSYAFFRRFLIVEWSRNMRSTAKHVVDIGRSIAEREKPGIAAWAVEGAARLQRQRQYTTSPSGEARLARWRQDADSVAVFVNEKCRPLQPGTPITRGVKATPLYGQYRTWVQEHGFLSVNVRKFASRMEELGLKSKHCDDGNYYPVESASSGQAIEHVPDWCC